MIEGMIERTGWCLSEWVGVAERGGELAFACSAATIA